MVLPEVIETSTSPLPRECSTTELRQHLGSSEPNWRREWRSNATGLALLQLSWQTVKMTTSESEKNRPQREADRRKRQAEALKANLKRRKAGAETAEIEEKDENSA
jgi:hypothetical protein